MAAGTVEGGAIAAEEHAHMHFVALPFEVLEEIVDAVEALGPFPDQPLMIYGQRLKGCFNVDSMFFDSRQHLLLPPGRAGFGPGLHGSSGEGFGVVGNDELRIVPQHIAESFALRAGAEWMIERKENRPEWLKGTAATLAEKLCAVRLSPMVDDVDGTTALSFAKCRFNCLDKSSAIICSNDETIQDDVE